MVVQVGFIAASGGENFKLHAAKVRGQLDIIETHRGSVIPVVDPQILADHEHVGIAVSAPDVCFREMVRTLQHGRSEQVEVENIVEMVAMLMGYHNDLELRYTLSEEGLQRTEILSISQVYDDVPVIRSLDVGRIAVVNVPNSDLKHFKFSEPRASDFTAIMVASGRAGQSLAAGLQSVAAGGKSGHRPEAWPTQVGQNSREDNAPGNARGLRRKALPRIVPQKIKPPASRCTVASRRKTCETSRTASSAGKGEKVE